MAPALCDPKYRPYKPTISPALTLTLTFVTDRLQLSEMVDNYLFEFASMVKLEWRHGDQKVGKLSFYCAHLP